MREQVVAGQRFREHLEAYWQACERWADLELESAGAVSKEAAKKPAKVAGSAEKEPAKADKPKKASPAKRAAAPKETVSAGAGASASADAGAELPARKKKGWWQRG